MSVQIVSDGSRLATANIIGLCGPKFHGKDTLAEAILFFRPGWKIKSFARPLKEICSAVFEMDIENFDAPHLKEVPFASPLDLRNWWPRLELALGIDFDDVLSISEKRCKRVPMTAKTPREILQIVGTDYARAVNDTYWIDAMDKNLPKEPNEGIIVTDARFDNEAIWIAKNGGIVVQVGRPFAHSSGDTHVSELGVNPALVNFRFLFPELDEIMPSQTHKSAASLVVDLLRYR